VHATSKKIYLLLLAALTYAPRSCAIVPRTSYVTFRPATPCSGLIPMHLVECYTFDGELIGEPFLYYKATVDTFIDPKAPKPQPISCTITEKKIKRARGGQLITFFDKNENALGKYDCASQPGGINTIYFKERVFIFDMFKPKDLSDGFQTNHSFPLDLSNVKMKTIM
jgi:hypothetical protein